MSLHDRTKRSTEELIRNCPTWLLRVSLLTTSGAAAPWKHFAVSMMPAMLAEAEASGAEGQGELWSMGHPVNDNWRHTHTILIPEWSLCPSSSLMPALLPTNPACDQTPVPLRGKRHQQGCGWLLCLTTM